MKKSDTLKMRKKLIRALTKKNNNAERTSIITDEVNKAKSKYIKQAFWLLNTNMCTDAAIIKVIGGNFKKPKIFMITRLEIFEGKDVDTEDIKHDIRQTLGDNWLIQKVNPNI